MSLSITIICHYYYLQVPVLLLATAAVVLMAAVKEVLQTVTVTPTATSLKIVAVMSHQHAQNKVADSS